MTLSTEKEKLLQSLLTSDALHKFQSGRKQEITFVEACRFWGVTDNLNGAAVDARLDHMQAGLAGVERDLGTGSATLADGRSLSTDDTEQLCDLHDYLEERFTRHLTLLRNRAGRG